MLHNFNPSTTDGVETACRTHHRSCRQSLWCTTYVGGTHYSGTVFEPGRPTGAYRLDGEGVAPLQLQQLQRCGRALIPTRDSILDGTGNLYGTTIEVAASVHSDGVVFELSPNGSGGWRETVLHSFNNDGSDGAEPFAGLILDSARQSIRYDFPWRHSQLRGWCLSCRPMAAGKLD